MKLLELSISVGELLGVPKTTLRGCLDVWHDQAVAGVLQGFADQGISSVVLDMAELAFSGTSAAAAMINVLRTLPEGLCVHVVAHGRPKDILCQVSFPHSVRLYSSADEIAQYLLSSDTNLSATAKRAANSEQNLPMAA